MAEYITKEQAFELLDDGDMYARKALTKMKPADVIEREKINKAIEEMEKEVYEAEDFLGIRKDVIAFDDVLEILKRNIVE